MVYELRTRQSHSKIHTVTGSGLGKRLRKNTGKAGTHSKIHVFKKMKIEMKKSNTKLLGRHSIMSTISRSESLSLESPLELEPELSE